MNSMIQKRAKVLVAMAVVLLAFLAMRLPQQTRAQLIEIAPPPPDRAFSPMAIAFGQTARVNIASYEDPNELPPGTTCGIIINYFAADGTLLAPAFSGQVELGKTVFVDLNRNSLPSVPPSQANLVDLIPISRVPFRVAVRLIGDPHIVPNPCSHIRASVELYDNSTGRTTVLVDDPDQ